MYKEKLIELLSDYMDKTLSIWCYVRYSYETETERDPNAIGVYIKMFDDFYKLSNDMAVRNIKILGHFTMDSIMRYLANCNTEVILSLDKDRVHILTGNADKAPSIPNKPLSTFTEEEYKALYNNLKGLCG